MKAPRGWVKPAPKGHPPRVFIAQKQTGAKTIMSNESLSYYEAVLADLEREREQLDAQRQELDGLIEGIRGRIRRLGGLSLEEAKEVTQPQSNGTKPYVGMSIYDAAAKYLDTVKGPRTVRQIWEALTEGGLPGIAYNAAYTALWRREAPKGEFERIGEKFWGLAEWGQSGGRQAKTDVPQKTENIQVASKSGMTLLDLCEAHLRYMGRPLHISALLSWLAERGQVTNADSLSSNMRKEKRQRFKNVGNNTWGLAEWKGDAQAASNASPPPSTRTASVSSGGVKLSDLCETILREAGKPLHGKVILEKLAEKNRPTSPKSLSGTMPQDTRKRFENLGENVWALAEWPESAKAAYRARKEFALSQ